MKLFFVLLLAAVLSLSLAQRGITQQHNIGHGDRQPQRRHHGDNKKEGLFGHFGMMSFGGRNKEPNETLPDPSVCQMKVRLDDVCVGELNKTHARFFYEPTANKCKMFIGCKPATPGNNFQRIEGCAKVCGANLTGDGGLKDIMSQLGMDDKFTSMLSSFASGFGNMMTMTGGQDFPSAAGHQGGNGRGQNPLANLINTFMAGAGNQGSYR